MKDSGATVFIQKFLGTAPDECNIAPDETRKSLIHLERSFHAGHQHLVYAAHIIFRYQLLDVVADVLGTPRHPDFIHVPRTSPPNFKDVARLSKVFRSTFYASWF
jgi:hypothetical protein